jgi:hypothetical protein
LHSHAHQGAALEVGDAGRNVLLTMASTAKVVAIELARAAADRRVMT